MPATPQITLNVNLLDLFGAQLGSVSQPAYIRIALCAAGQYLPAIPGTGMAGRIATWPEDIPYLGVAQAIKLWGNDVITPPNTYYMISILDNKRNVIQAVPYQFTGTTTYDLSTASPYGFPPIVPVVPTITGGLVVIPFSSGPIFNCSLINAGVITFQITLTGDVLSSTLINASPGQIVTFIIFQDGTGNHLFAWPSNVHNTTVVNPVASSVTVQSFIVRSDGTLLPIGAGTYN
jgi:hypothetical protein